MFKSRLTELFVMGIFLTLVSWGMVVWLAGCSSTQQDLIATTSTTTSSTVTSGSSTTTLHIRAWGTPERIATAPDFLMYPRIALDSSSNAIAVWQQWSNPYTIGAIA